jgi:sulfur carrier protein
MWNAMRIVVNGKDIICADCVTVRELLTELRLSAQAVLVERNAQILPRTNYETTVLEDGDSLELIRFVGGG